MLMLKDDVAFLVGLMKAFRVVASLNIIPCPDTACSCLGRKI